MNRLAKFFRDYAFARFALPVGLILIIFGGIIYGPVVARQNFPRADVAPRDFDPKDYTGNNGPLPQGGTPE